MCQKEMSGKAQSGNQLQGLSRFMNVTKCNASKSNFSGKDQTTKNTTLICTLSCSHGAQRLAASGGSLFHPDHGGLSRTPWSVLQDFGQLPPALLGEYGWLVGFAKSSHSKKDPK